ncbi:MAG: SDR family oxidoreductase [Deinococcus sp.]|nr:SDR family oxidoreductase [Deinococcus sp.]
MRLLGKVAVITGSSSGIGEAIARRFAQEGARVVVNSYLPEPTEQVAKDLDRQGYEAMAVIADVTRKADAERLVAASLERWGALDILVNNAGVASIISTEECSEEEWRRVLDINLTGVFLCSQAAAQIMLPRGQGSIVNTASVFGPLGVPRRAAYCASKAGVIGLTKALAVEWAGRGVRVNAINPGYVRTTIDTGTVDIRDYSDADVQRRTPLGRYGRVDELAAAALFLASGESSYLTGAVLNVDGGWSAYGGW